MTRAGQKIRAWRHSRQPRVKQAELAAELGVSMHQLLRWEQGASVCSDVHVLHRLQGRGICALEDWTVPAITACGICRARPGTGEARMCQRAVCGLACLVERAA